MTLVRRTGTPLRALACMAALCAVLALPAGRAHADVAMTSTPRDTPISAYKGTLAWSQWDTVKHQYRLILTTIKTGKQTTPSIKLRPTPFDVSLACATFRPCRLVRADPSVFGSGERRLAPRLTFQAPPSPLPADQPLALSGTLTTPVVRQGTLIRSEPVAGAALEGLQATDLNSANGENLRPTGRTVTTAADGTWSPTLLPPLPADGFYAAITRSLPVAAQSPVIELKTSP